jgi:hypothetical protein
MNNNEEMEGPICIYSAQDRVTAPCCVSEKPKQKWFFARYPCEKATPFRGFARASRRSRLIVLDVCGSNGLMVKRERERERFSTPKRGWVGGRLLGGLEKEMGAGAEVMHQVVPLLEAPFHRCAITNAEVIVEAVGVTTASLQPAVSLRAVVEVAVEVSDLVSFRFQLPIILPLMF